MAFQCVSVAKSVAVYCLMLVSGPTGVFGNFLRLHPQAVQHPISRSMVEGSLQAALEGVMGEGGAAARRLATIEASLSNTMQALPKNAAGRLAPKAVRYMVHNYFAKEHGWLIKGMELDDLQQNATELHEASVLQQKAPALVQALLAERESGRGLDLRDVVAMIAAIESLVFDESVSLLEASYFLNGLRPDQRLEESSLREVLTSYMLIFEEGGDADLDDVHGHQVAKQLQFATDVGKYEEFWQGINTFAEDSLRNFDYVHRNEMNPFKGRTYGFEAASHIVANIATAYGKWQDADCRDMKDILMSLGPKGSGRLSLDDFYSNSLHEKFQFTESEDYLRENGILEDGPTGSTVRIANYMNGPSNCIAPSAYYSVCCLNECEVLMNDLEGEVREPTASVVHLLDIIGNLSSSTVDAPREIAGHLKKKLSAIAERHSGAVPLHGRLFAQWMHLAFPNECPYPYTNPTLDASREVGNVTKTEDPRDAAANFWTDEEVLPLLEPEQQASGVFTGIVRSLMPLFAMAAMLAVVLRSGLSAWMHVSGKAPTGKPVAAFTFAKKDHVHMV